MATSHLLSDPHIRSAIRIVNGIPGAWEFFRSFEPKEGEGYLFSKLTPLGCSIQDAICNEQTFHSGPSLAGMMRALQFVSKHHSNAELLSLEHEPEVAESSSASAEGARTQAGLGEPSAAGSETTIASAPQTMAAQREAFLALPNNMSLADQMSELANHWNTPMSYMEMRMRFG